MIISGWYDITLLIISGISLMGTVYTMSLILWVTPKSMSEYRWFLLLYTFWDGVFTLLLGIIFCPKFLFPSGSVLIQGLGHDIYYIVKGMFGIEGGDFIMRFGFMGLTWQVVNIIAAQDYCLIYRFTVVHPNQRYHDLLINKKIVVLMICFEVFICFLFNVPCFMAVLGEKDIPNAMKEYDKKYPGIFDEVKPNSVILFLNTEIKEITLLFGLIFFGFIFAEIIAVPCVFVILKILRQNASSFSAHTYKLHRQMTFFLIVQILNPFIFLICPIMACVIAVVFNFHYEKPSGMYGVMFMSLYSISNTILTVSCVTPYRQFTFKYTIGIILKFPCLKKYHTVAPVIAPIQSTSNVSLNTQLVRRHQ